MAYRNYHPSNGFFVSQDGNGDFTTITAASNAIINAGLTDISVFIHDGTYTENPPLAPGCDYVAFNADQLEPNVIINGNCTFSSAGTVAMTGIEFQTNSNYFLSVTGNQPSIVLLNGCYFNINSFTGILFNSSSSSALINVTSCQGNIGNPGYAIFSHSSAGTLNFVNTEMNNTGSSITPNICSSGVINLSFSIFTNQFLIESSAAFTFINCLFQSVNPTTTLTLAGSGLQVVRYCTIISGSGIAVICSSSSPTLEFCVIRSSNTYAISGTGTLTYSNIVFEGSSSAINSTLTLVPNISKTINIQTFTSTGTYTPTPGMINCIVELVGGGGAGGGGAMTNGSQVSVGCGGGGGEYAKGLFTASTIGTSQAVTIGAAGTVNSGSTGGNGGTTSLGSLITAIGGSGGTTAGPAVATNSEGTLGGTGGTGGNFRIPGCAGGGAFGATTPGGFISGQGGNSFFGAGGISVAPNSAGIAGLGYGAGGSGAALQIVQGSNNGGAGTNGIVIITEYIQN